MNIGTSFPYGTGRYAQTRKNNKGTFSIMPGYTDTLTNGSVTKLNIKIPTVQSASPNAAGSPAGEQAGKTETASSDKNQTSAAAASHDTQSASSTPTAQTAQPADSQTGQTRSWTKPPASEEHTQIISQAAAPANGINTSFMSTVLNQSQSAQPVKANTQSDPPPLPFGTRIDAQALAAQIEEKLNNKSVEDWEAHIADYHENHGSEAEGYFLREQHNKALAREAGDQIQNPQPAEQAVDSELYALDVGAAFDEYKKNRGNTE